MDTPHWPQEMVVKAIEADIVVVTNSTRKGGGVESRKQARPQKEEAINCPRCNSINTKFCYYNNYSLTQPRYFCKTCRRYWTEGGSLRNIPVGGGCRKNNKTRSSSASTSNKNLPPDLLIAPPTFSHTPQTQNPKSNTNNINLQGQDLNLSFTTPDFRKISELVQQNNNNSSNSMSASASSSSSTTTTITTTASTSHQLSALELLTGITSSTSTTAFTSFMPMPVVPATDPNSVYTCGFPLQDFKPTLNFSLENGYHPSLHNNVQTGRLLFPFEDLNLKQDSGPTNTMDQKQQGDHSTHGYWTGGMLGGGSW